MLPKFGWKSSAPYCNAGSVLSKHLGSLDCGRSSNNKQNSEWTTYQFCQPTVLGFNPLFDPHHCVNVFFSQESSFIPNIPGFSRVTCAVFGDSYRTAVQ